MQRMDAIELARESDHCIQPAEAFSLLGNEIRVQILETLWRAEEQPVPFSTLYDAVGIRSSSKFNYHLDKLSDQYIRKSDEGYELRTAGENVVRAIAKGSFNAHPRYESFEVGDACTNCDEPLVARYEDEMLAVDCPFCGRGHGRYPFPPGGMLDRDDREILAAFDRRVRHDHNLAKDGVCPQCSGRMRSIVAPDGSECHGGGIGAQFVCEQCDHTLSSAIGLSLLDRSPVVSFYRDHGVDLGRERYWRLPWCVSDDCTTVRSTDPWRFDVEIAVESETLCPTLDGDLNLVECRRVSH